MDQFSRTMASEGSAASSLATHIGEVVKQACIAGMDRTKTPVVNAPLLYQSLNQESLVCGGKGKLLQGRGELNGSAAGSDAAESYAGCGYEPAKP